MPDSDYLAWFARNQSRFALTEEHRTDTWAGWQSMAPGLVEQMREAEEKLRRDVKEQSQ